MDKNIHNYRQSKVAKVSKNKFFHNICIFSIAFLWLIIISFVIVAKSECGDVKVMYAIGLYEKGEDCKLLSAADYEKTKLKYNEFKELLEKAVTLRDMARGGWKIVYVNPIDSERHLLIFER